MNDLAVIILAAGKGSRMRSDLPKVFHEILGEPMLTYTLESVKKLSPQRTLLVVGHKRELIMDYYKDWELKFVVQDEQLGTGHAVMQAKPFLDDFDGRVLIVNGDVPLITDVTLRKLVDFHIENKAAATDLTAVLDDAGNYGRIVRKENGEVVKIVEKKDASPEELKINEINTGTFCFNKKALYLALAEVRAENAQKEYYLTDTIEILQKKNLPVYAFRADDPNETLGVNTKEELVGIEKILLSRET
ncbi:MAG: sugar phosphate nucleotidyltransferase [Candidatus Margulisiibacteriota bacterium]|nr:sugar phosphate nucleotidyltransferase [Candidatus Margulisiibacteriota bacterium]